MSEMKIETRRIYKSKEANVHLEITEDKVTYITLQLGEATTLRQLIGFLGEVHNKEVELNARVR